MVSLSDYLQSIITAVCKRWCCFARHNKKQQRRPDDQLPFLLIPTNDQEHLRLYSVTNNMKFYFQVKVPYPHTHRVFGSSHGWLFTTDESMTITLFNPYSGRKVRLPPITREISGIKDYNYKIAKAILSMDPLLFPDNFEVAIIYGGSNLLALFKSSDKSWSYLEDDLGIFEDIIYHKGELHAVDYWMRLVRITSSESQSKSSQIMQVVESLPPNRHNRYRSIYIVETSSEDLLLIQRMYDIKCDDLHLCVTMGCDDHDEHSCVTMGFRVFDLVHSSDPKKLSKWVERVETKSLGDDALFLGINYSMSLSTLDFPGCQPNCIYYTDDGVDDPFGPRDMGVFNLKDQSFNSHYVSDPLHKDMPPPIWIVPTGEYAETRDALASKEAKDWN